MDISVIWIPETSAGERLIEIRKPLAAHAGASPGYYPHLTLGVYYGVPFEPLDAYTRKFAMRIHQFSVRYTKLVQLTPAILALEVENKGAVQSYYAEYHKEFEEYADEWTHKGEGKYLPHSTLLYLEKPEDRNLLADADTGFEPFDAKIVKVQLSRFYEEGRYEILSSYDLDE